MPDMLANPTLLPLQISPSQSLGWPLPRKSYPMENLPNMSLMIHYPKLRLDHMLSPRTRPNARRKSISHRPTIQNLRQTLQLLLCQSPGPPRMIFLPEAPLLCPASHTDPTNKIHLRRLTSRELHISSGEHPF